jgi:PKD repeat protein
MELNLLELYMKRLMIMVVMGLMLCLPKMANALDVIGNINVNTTWSLADSPVVLTGDVTIATQATLTIEDGVTIEVANTDGLGSGQDNSRIELIVRGGIVANGTATDPIIIRGQESQPGSWYGISLEPTATSSSFTFVQVSDAQLGLWIRTINPLILSDSKISNCENGILWQSTLSATMDRIIIGEIQTTGIQIEDDGASGTSALISDVTLSKISGTGIVVTPRTSATIQRSSIMFGNKGIVVESGASAIIKNNVIAGNEICGLDLTQSGANAIKVFNNTVDMNIVRIHDSGSAGTGIVIKGTSSPSDFIIRNNIITNHGTFGIELDTTTAPSMDHNNVWGNGTNYSAGLSAGTGSIATNPLYVQELTIGDWVAVSDPVNVSNPGNNYSNQWDFHQNGAYAIRLNFSNVSTETNYDFLRIYNDESVLLQTISGTFSGYSDEHFGNYLELTFDTDGSNFSSGFSLIGYEYRTTLYNYRLQQSSPVIDVGNDLDAPGDDADGSSRPYDGDVDGTLTTDIGAYEWHENIPPSAHGGSDHLVLPGTQIDFNAVASFDPDGTIASYEWDFGDSSSTETTPQVSHTYNTIGTYTVTLKVWDNLGAMGNDTLTVEVTDNLPPTAIAGDDQYVEPSALVSFSGGNSYDSDGSVVNYEWDFGDSAPAGNGPNVTHVYSSAGVYTVTLTVTDNMGSQNSDTLSVVVGNVQNNVPPVAHTGGPYSSNIGDTIDFDGSSSLDTDGSIVSWSWDYGDGNIDTGEQVSHIFESAGNYLVTLTVTDNLGASDDDTTLVTVSSPDNTPPFADGGGNLGGDVDESLLFDGSLSTDSDGTIVDYSWDFGDGNSGTGSQVDHSYSAPGSYLVKLTVTDNDGAIGQDVILANIGSSTSNESPVADAGNSSTVEPNTQIYLDGSGSVDPDGNIVSWDWDFGDGNTDSGEIVEHTFELPGTYLVTLIVTDNEGAYDDDVILITVPGEDTSDDSSDGCSCSVGKSKTPPMGFIFLLFGLIIIRRRLQA